MDAPTDHIIESMVATTGAYNFPACDTVFASFWEESVGKECCSGGWRDSLFREERTVW